LRDQCALMRIQDEVDDARRAHSTRMASTRAPYSLSNVSRSTRD
jgi:hypothetical protein